ncbi:MAG TPA: amidohydrolase family protein [Candidatus Bathyarchaeia archaeon]|nr:amidohydrolase family protein [Candidatus Bathyarchaeia archaeon]
MQTGFRVISADSHVVEPLSLWSERAERRYRERVPRLVRELDGKVGNFVVCEDAMPVPLAAFSSAGMSAEELSAAFARGEAGVRRGAYEPRARLEDMQADGIAAEVLYPSVALQLFRLGDGTLQAECFRVYNDWLAEYCMAARDCLVGVALISLFDVVAAVKEIERARELGLSGAMIWGAPPVGDSYASERYDRVWAAAAAAGLPLSLHLGTNRELAAPGESIAVAYMLTILPVQRALSQLILGGVLERYRDLRFVSVENEVGWLPHFLARMDHGAEKYRAVSSLTLAMRPSEYFHRQIFATFQEDRIGIEARARIGVGNLMWASDYPHSDSTWPRSREVIARDFAGVPEDERAMILGGNVARLYGIDA